MKYPALLVALACIISSAVAADPAATQPADAEYDAIVRERARKIVEPMNLPDPQRADRVVEIIARQYKDLARLHDAGKADPHQADTVQAEVGQAVATLHEQYLARLAAELTAEQVEQVKDGMTYNVVNVTYNGFLEMLPDLTEAQKAVILTMLKEAREHAMDAGTAKEKHAWFGKYKGRINNYLSREGYDLKQASKDWAQRRRQQGSGQP